MGIFLPRFVIERMERQECEQQRATIEAEYHKTKTHCPVCLKLYEGEVTCMGPIVMPGVPYMDNNHVHCQCGWRGRVHGLISADEARTTQISRDHNRRARQADTFWEES
jgi:hypothetical protein